MKRAQPTLTEAQFFKGHPVPRALYRAVKKQLARLGPMETRITKSEIAFRTTRAFAFAWMPQKWLTSAPPDALVISFALDKKLRSSRFKEVTRLRSGRFMHHVVLHDAAHFDAQLLGWLKQARAA